MSIFNANDRKVRKLEKIASKIDALSGEYKALTDEQLANKTVEFRDRLEKGATLDDILVEAYAAVREAATRTVGLTPFKVQLIGAIALHQGRIAEMSTGEGKTLVATMPAYLNALKGKVHVVTVNEYLAVRDARWMGKIYEFLGLTVGVNLHDLDMAEKKRVYDCDIVYSTNSELGFDFLRDNMIVNKSFKVQHELNFAIIDEVDSILIDEARTPLLISGAGKKNVDIYKKADRFARGCKEDTTVDSTSDQKGNLLARKSGELLGKTEKSVPSGTAGDFVIDEKEKTIMLTEAGIVKAERFFNVENLTDIENTDLYHHIQQALRANFMMKKDKDYIVDGGEVFIVDAFTGRVMIGRRYSDGLHQAIEAKEGVAIRSENRTVATITIQNLFRMYKKLSGMTGTAKTEEDEFQDIYALDVVTIPTNRPCVRIDEHDKIYVKENYKKAAIVDDIISCYNKVVKDENGEPIKDENGKEIVGQPVLVGTVSVEKSEELSRILKNKNIPHHVLNAKYHKEEAYIIAQAGRSRAVTIATNMAGRGTDILLGGNPEYLAKQAMMVEKRYEDATIEAATSLHPADDAKVLEARQDYLKKFEWFAKDCEKDKKKVVELGGLRIIGTERHESRRIDNQLRGRAGRQGDPGSSVFYVSLDDDIARIFGGDKLKNFASMITEEDGMRPLSNSFFTKSIESAQKRVEGRNFTARKRVLSYDDVINAQREIIYTERGKVLDGLDVHDQIIDMIGELAEDIISAHADYSTDYVEWDYAKFNMALEQKLLPQGSNVMTPELCSCYDVYKLKKAVMDIALKDYEDKIAKCAAAGVDFKDMERYVLLKNVDAKWIDYIDSVDMLRQGIGLRQYGQRDPIIAFKQESWDMFDEMVKRIHLDTATVLIKTYLREEDNKLGGAKRDKLKAPEVRANRKIGRNEPCPCGSGKKYKDCHGKNARGNFSAPTDDEE